jgi:ABC-type multidrug transport system fused ATPase/permease subunit
VNLIVFGIYAIIIGQALNGSFGPIQTSIGTVVLMLQLTLQAQFPLFASSFIVDQIQRAAARSKDFFEVMELTPKILDADGAGEARGDGFGAARAPLASRRWTTSALPHARMAPHVDAAQHDELVAIDHIEDSIRKTWDEGPTHRLADDRRSFGPVRSEPQS